MKSRCPDPISVSAKVANVGAGGDAAEFLFGGYVGGDRLPRFAEDRHAGAGLRFAQNSHRPVARSFGCPIVARRDRDLYSIELAHG